MPLFDMECPRCKETWEALVVNSERDGIQYHCPKCTHPGVKQVSKNVVWNIWGYSERNSYGLKKFKDEKMKA